MEWRDGGHRTHCGTVYVFQATPGQRHADLIRGELDQIECKDHRNAGGGLSAL